MKYCTRCLYPANHPLGVTFDEQGVCSGCRVHEEKDTLDWAPRREKLRSILEGYRSRTRTTHDCVVPVSGARDSWFIVQTLKNEFGMTPLLVHYNAHWNTRVGIRNLAYLRTVFGCDIIQQTLSPAKVKKLTRAALALRASMYWHVLAGATVFPVQVAVRFKIPLIVWGAHQGLDQVGMFSHTDEVEMTRKYRKEHDLMGLEPEDMPGLCPDVGSDDVEPLFYPHDRELDMVGVRGIYLNNYIRWDSKAQHEAMISLHGYETAPQQRTFDTYNHVDSFHYAGLHDAIKFAKWGYGKATDHACREIRLRRMTREQGIALASRHQQFPAADEHLFLDWLGLSREELWSRVDARRDPAIWSRNDAGCWLATDNITNHAHDEHVDAARLELREDDCRFVLTPSREPGIEDSRYILLGRGHVDL